MGSVEKHPKDGRDGDGIPQFFPFKKNGNTESLLLRRFIGTTNNYAFDFAVTTPISSGFKQRHLLPERSNFILFPNFEK